jgi:cation:H+ antiporter
MTTPLLILIAGIACAVTGGTIFVRGIVGLAAWWRVPAGIIGATVAAFATSGPELSVAVNSALADRPQIALGDALGSNVVNIGLIVGLALVFGAISVPRDTLVRDIPLAMLSPAVLILVAIDGRISRVDGVIMIVVFSAWLIQTTLAARRQRDLTAEVMAERNHRRILIDASIGLVLLILAGRLVTISADGISTALGWDGFLVGVIFVSIGTSTPEIATMLASRIQKHDEVGVGAVLGSNIFNTLLIVGTAALISPIPVIRAEMITAAVASIVVVALVIPGGRLTLGRARSLPLLAAYAGMLVLIST